MVLLLCFGGFVILVWSFRWLRSFRFDGFVLAFRVLVHALLNRSLAEVFQVANDETVEQRSKNNYYSCCRK